jgi:FrmR/RcnR family transcriptional regulator, repressor of frmRAB operon
MTHTIRSKHKLRSRVGRIRGQVEAIDRALANEEECANTLQLIASCRGAINGLMAEVIEGHIRSHLVGPKELPTSERSQAAQELLDVVKTYLR